MATYVDLKNGNIYFGGHKTLADARGKDVTSIPKAIKALVEAGLLEVIQPGGSFKRAKCKLLIADSHTAKTHAEKSHVADFHVEELQGVPRKNAEGSLQNYSLKREQ